MQLKKYVLLILLVITFIAGVILDIMPMQLHDGIDKFWHFIAFAVFSTLVTLCYAAFFGIKNINSFLVVLLIVGGMAACCSELLQTLSDAERDCSVWDWLFDISAIGTVGGIAYLYYSKKLKAETVEDIDLFENEIE